MAGGKTTPSQKRKPPHQKGMKVNKVAYGAGEPFGADGSGRNKQAKALDEKGIKKGAPVSRGMHENSGNDSPVGRERPTQDGGPRSGQKSGVDFKITDKHPTKKDYGWSV